jgi:hypothetical protein
MIKNCKIFNNNGRLISGLLDGLDKKIENKKSKGLTRDSRLYKNYYSTGLIKRLNNKIRSLVIFEIERER